MLAEIDTVIFDLDGLLLDSEKLYTQAANEYLNPLGKKVTWDFKLKVMGRPYRDVISILIEHYGLNTTADELMPIIANIEYDLFRKVEVMPGSMRLLNYLVRNNIPIALATGSSEQKVQIKTGHLPDLIKCFPLERRVTADFHKLQPGRGKPNPDVFIYAAELLGRTTEEQRKRCLVFEDGVPGVMGSRAAGMEVIWVPDHEAKKHRDADPNAPEIHPSQILSSLNDFKPEEWGLPAGF